VVALAVQPISFTIRGVKDREVNEDLWFLCDTAIEGGPESVQETMSTMSRDQLETALAEAVRELLDATSRAEKEIERFQRRLAKRRS
jgi:hypothetical protein